MPRILIIAGPTAGGKSAKALEMATAHNGVIINCDSMQIYDGLHILTAHPSKEDQAQAPHELYGVLHPNETCSAGNWRNMAEPVIQKILTEGKTPIICGGTGLYIKSLVEGLSPMPGIPAEIRARSIEMQKEWDAPTLHAYLKERDPVMAARLDPQNRARMIRAIEVLEATGKSLGEWQKESPLGPPADWDFEIHKIMPERDELHRRCNERFLKMLESGALDEVKDFALKLESGEINTDTPLNKALGLKPLMAYLKGSITKEEAIEKAQTDTRQYVKRQVTWFKNQL